jgi:hypothetical protein
LEEFKRGIESPAEENIHALPHDVLSNFDSLMMA